MDFDLVVKDYLTRRKISPAVQEEFNIHAGKMSHGADCIVIPVMTEAGVFSYNKYRRSPLSEEGPKYLYDKGGSMMLYGAWKAREEGRVLWTEGELDCLVAWSANIPAVSSTGGAQSIDEKWADFFKGKDVVICFDNDKAGGEGMVKALAVAPHARIMFLPDGANVKDISEYVERGGDLASLMKTARHFSGYADIVADRAERLATWKSTFFHDAMIRDENARVAEARREERRVPSRGDADAVKRAKQFPISELLKFDNRGMARCLWHAETEGSLHYYKNDNHCYCFGGCGRAFDAIDVYRKLNDCGFKEAVEKLQ